uniref:Uncharacterized protein n=1 Tax=Anguilla anguilla TaxID=7936 RepID=A0A0E9RHC7_ANGAN
MIFREATAHWHSLDQTLLMFTLSCQGKNRHQMNRSSWNARVILHGILY